MRLWQPPALDALRTRSKRTSLASTRRVADDPLHFVREAINDAYHIADKTGDEKLRHCALMLLSDLTRRRRDAGLPEYRIELQSPSGTA